MAKNILITGGAGFVGSHLADALLAAGHHVRVFDNLTRQVHHDGLPAYLSREVEFLAGNIQDATAVRRALDSMDVVYHLAAAVGVGQSMYEIEHYMGTNTQGTAVLLQELLNRKSQVQKLVLASSMSIYGEGKYLCAHCGEMSPGLRSAEQLRTRQWEPECPKCGEALTPIPTDESKPLQCSSIYALSKKDQEEMCLLFGRTYELPVVALRYFNPPMIFEDGRQLRDFVSVKDVVQANLLAMDRPEADGMALNIGSGEPISIREVAAELSRAMQKDIPAALTFKYRAGDVRHCFADISAAGKLLGYAPRVRFADGLKDLVQWLCSQQPQDRAAEAVAQLSEFGLTA
jgi:dTDP-L-rhamnose 4-epimerase